jgi:hypothetical protein
MLYRILLVGSCLLFTLRICKAQVVSEDYILSTPVTLAEKIKIPKSDTVMVLPFSFGDFTIQTQKTLDSINRRPIEKIVLVYTRYKKSEDFSQETLNRNRLEQFRKQCPYIFNNNLITWELIEQTGAKNDEEAKKYFHGILIYFRGKNIKKELTTAEEISFIKKRLGDHCRVSSKDTVYDLKDLSSSKPIETERFFIVDTLIKLGKGKYKGEYIPYTKENFRKKDRQKKEILEASVLHRKFTIRSSYEVVSYRTEMRKDGGKIYYDPRSKSKLAKGKLYTHKSIWGRAVHYDTIATHDTLWITLDTAYRIRPICIDVFKKSCMDGVYKYSSSSYRGNRYADTIVQQALPTIKNSQNTILVEDVTGSMNPYLLQTFLWRRKVLATCELSRFVFFNDGDNKPDAAKVIGNTGGIYSVNSINVDSVEQVAFSTMRKGNGGDGPENNLEALLFASALCPECDLLMIADNLAPVKDLELISKINKPVRIILCGAYSKYYQSDYLTIARATKGSILTMEGELKDVLYEADGTRIKVGEQYFILKDGRFILTR